MKIVRYMDVQKMKSGFVLQTRSRAFTLTELLITIGIIVILICLLFPAMGKIKESAYSSKCISNMKGIGQAVALYASENYGKYPTFGQDLSGPNAQPYWGEKIEPYLGRHSKIYICPSERSKWATPDEQEKQPADFTYPGAWYAGISYGANPAVVSWTVSPNGNYSPTSPGTVTRPSQTVLLTDAWDDRTSIGTGISFVTGHLGEYSRMNPLNLDRSFIRYRHGGKATVCFVDGHVVQLTEKQLMPDKNKPEGDPDRSLWDLN